MMTVPSQPRGTSALALVCGDRDVRAPLPVAKDLHAAIPGSTLVVLPDAGHLCSLEAPQAFNRAVGNFFRDRRS